MDIVLVPLGKIDPDTLDMIRDDLRAILKKEITIREGLPEPGYALNPKRGQLLSTAILKVLMQQEDVLCYGKILGLVDQDLYVPELNFVFGEASRRAAVISLTRLRETYYGQPENPGLFRRRIGTEAVHELGHTYGFGHCRNPLCVMFFSNHLAETDRKGPRFCPECKKRYDALA